ncbi:MAG: glutamate racemase [Clostridiales bacterium]|nr:glutamate racemase [Clostridiales bacterium]
MADNRPIGVFDSGIGGLTVLREIWEELPNESTIYFGDNGRAPYGTKSHDTIVKYALQDLKFLESRDVKLVVIACYTASAHAYKDVLKTAKVPVVEVVYPGAYAACKETETGKIGIIATKATVSSDVYKNAVFETAEGLIKEGVNQEALKGLEVHSVACPLFAPLVEAGWWDRKATELIAEEYLAPLKEKGIDTLVLGCTHYPLLTDVIGRIMGPSVKLINGGRSVAKVVSKTLSGTDSLASGDNKAVYEFFTSDNPSDFEDIASPFLGGGRPSGTRHVDEN